VLALEQSFAVLEHLGDSYVDDDPALAEGYFLRPLADNPALKFTKATQHIKLAELRIRLRDEQSLEEGGRPPRSVDRSSPSSFPEAQFRWNIAEIELAEATRDRDAAREAAGGVESENKEPEATARCG
jgi:hypothetical protein